jgi:cell division protein FtsB
MAKRQKSVNTEKKKFRRTEGASPAGVIVILFILILFAVGASMLIRQNIVEERVKARAEQLEEEHAQALAENENAQALANKVGSDDFVEEVARDELGMVKVGEIIYDTKQD